MPALPEPRCFAATTIDPLSRLATGAVRATDAAQRHKLLSQLEGELRDIVAGKRDELLADAMANVTSPVAGVALLEALDHVINTPAGNESGLAARVFAIPVVFVAAGVAGAEISGVIPNTQAIVGLLERHGALGPARALGLSQALCAESSLETDSPARWYALLRGVESRSPEIRPDLIPASICLESAEESVHLRFLVGSIVVPAQAPSFLETAANIAGWGMPLSRELLAQLGLAGLSLLPLPRPPAGLMKALHEGCRAREEVAFQAFTSRALRRMRSETGEPGAEVAALASGAIGVRLVPAFDRERAETHRWHLDMLDDLADVTGCILGLLADCRVSSVRVMERVVSDAEFLDG